MNKRIFIFLIMVSFAALFLSACGKNDPITEKNDPLSEIQKANRASVSFDLLGPGYVFSGEDVKKIISMIKPETWEKGGMTLELAAIEHIVFYGRNMKYIVAILDVENNEVMFETETGYYKTGAVGYRELMDSLRDMILCQSKMRNFAS